MKDPKDQDEIDIHEDDNEQDEMEKRFPNSSEASRNAGRFLGVDFPYIPGDPDF